MRVARRAGRLGDAERRQRLGGDDPGRDRAAEILAKEWTQGRHLPELDIARRPIVDEAQSEYLLAGPRDRDRLALAVAGADPHRQFELVIELLAGSKTRRCLVRSHAL